MPSIIHVEEDAVVQLKSSFLDAGVEYKQNLAKLDHLIEHVEKEIQTAENKMMDLESTGYDMAYILQQQNELQHHYAEKIRTMNDKNLQFRRRGEGNYANYNLSDYDDEEEDFEYYTHEYPRYYRRYYK